MQKIFLAIIVCIICFQGATGQNIIPQLPAKNHYAKFQAISPEKVKERSSLDSLKFFPEQYNSVALLYTMLEPEYLSKEQISILKKSVSFPANSSKQTEAEIDFLLEWQEKRTVQDIERAAQVLAPIGYWPHIDALPEHPGYEENLAHLFFEGREILGASVTPDRYPKTITLLKRATRDMRIIEFTVKYHLLRARPYVLEPRLEPLQIMSSPSFASGHTLWAYLHAYLWSELQPEKRTEFLNLAYEIGESREIMGIHYPSDEEAARLLAYRMIEYMFKNSDFLSDLKEAKQEWE